MKKFLALLLISVFAITTAFSLFGCNYFIDEKGNIHNEQGVVIPPEEDPGHTIAYTTEKSYPDGYGGIDLPDYVTPFSDGSDLTAFENMTLDFQKHQDAAIRRTVYYQMYVNRNGSFDGPDCYLNSYVIACSRGGDFVPYATMPHTIAYLDVAENVIENGVQIKITAQSGVSSVTVIPEKLGVTQGNGNLNWNNNDIYITVNQYKPYTILVDGKYDKPITIFVRKPEKVELPYGWTLKKVGPGIHLFGPDDVKKLFASGNRTIIYLEAGCVIVPINTGAFENRGSFFGYENELRDIKIIGHGVLDASKLGFHETLRAICMANTTNLEINGLTILNSCNWTMEIRGCNNVRIEDCIIFGYRTNSDGFCMTSSSNVVVENCFARSGDDLFEIKAASDSDIDNVVFNNCQAWADTCRCFGLIQETRSNISNVTFSNCSVLFQLSHWASSQRDKDKSGTEKGVDTDDTYMAAWVIAAAERGNIENILYDNCDINYCMAYAIGIAVGLNKETEIDFAGNYVDGLTFRNCSFYDKDSRDMYYGHVRFYNNSFNDDGTPMADAIRNVTFENLYLNGNKITNPSQLSTRYWGNAGSYIYEHFVTIK